MFHLGFKYLTQVWSGYQSLKKLLLNQKQPIICLTNIELLILTKQMPTFSPLHHHYLVSVHGLLCSISKLHSSAGFLEPTEETKILILI